MNKRNLLGLAIAALSTSTAMAGGLLTNTNNNAAFLRQMSQEAVIDVTGAYMNPAGIAFLGKGYHLSLNVQNAKQDRDIETTFPLFNYNTTNPSATHTFEGEASAPVIPSIQFAYVSGKKWSIGANLSLTGGGGKCEFDQGLGTFEALYAGSIYQAVGAALAQANATYGTDMTFGGYSIDAYMKGRQYFFGLSVAGNYKVTDNLAVSLGLRGVYATCNYNGWVEDAKAVILPGTKPAGQMVQPAVQEQVDAQLSQAAISLNTDQTGYGVTPIIGVDWKINDQWNVAAKYEFKTRLRLKNKSEMNEYTTQLAESNAVLAQFADGKKVKNDIPSFLAVGAQYSPIKAVRINAGFHFYNDCKASQYADKQKNIDGGTREYTAGVEYDACKWITVSVGGQKTNYDLKDAYMNDLSFVTSSYSLGGGIRVNATKRCSVDLSYMRTMYDEREVTTPTAAGNKVDNYKRTNRVMALAVNLKF